MQRSPALLPILLLAGAVWSVAQSSSATVQPAQPEPTPSEIQAPRPLALIPDLSPVISGASLPADNEAPTGPRNPLPAPARAKETETASPPPLQPPLEPKTEVLDASATSAAMATDGHDPILDPPPFPQGSITLAGGIISSVDRIRNHLTIAIFGGGSWTVYFDERTHIFRSGAETTVLALKKGERVYVDTMLDNNKRDIFARNIRVGVVTPPADAAGQIEQVDARHGQLTLRDNINSVSVRFAVDSTTRISRGSQPATLQDLVAGSLVRVQFAPDRPNRGLAREIVILALPGSVFTFAGTITFLDTHRNILSVHNTADDKTYDIYFVPSGSDAAGRLAVGAQVQVVAMFETTHYAAQRITVTKMAGAATK